MSKRKHVSGGLPANLHSYVLEWVSGKSQNGADDNHASKLLFVNQIKEALKLYGLPDSSLSAFIAVFFYYEKLGSDKSKAPHYAVVITIRYMAQFAQVESEAKIKYILKRLDIA